MPTYHDKNTNNWYCKFYYTDYTGTRKQKKKRGFKLQREAKEWEREFLENQQASMTMPFKAFIDIYLEDMSHRLRYNTIKTKKSIIEAKILPYFGDKPVNDIKPVDIRKWQNGLISYRDENGCPYKETYLKILHKQLTAIFNYAVKYYTLTENPCHKAGSMGKSKADEMEFYTFDEFNQLIAHVDDKTFNTIFMILYYTGMRKGELLALTPASIDLEKGIISITKSYQRLHKQDFITDPKTPQSIRDIQIPTFLVKVIKDYISSIYGICANDRIFTQGYMITNELKKAQAQANIKAIRVHDFRHGHASLLIELGYSPLLVAERLGDSVETVLSTYSHLYPNKQSELVEKLEEMQKTVPL